MPKFLFYTGTAFCLFLALTSAAAAISDLPGGSGSFIALGGPPSARAAFAVVVALLASVAAAGIFLRMAALVAARNLFAAFVALVTTLGSLASLVWVAMLQGRILVAMRARQAAGGVFSPLAEMHLAATLMLGYFVSLMLLSLRPYFRVQASRTLSALVFLPLPLMLLIVAQELFVRASVAPLPAKSPALVIFFAVLAILFFAISVHCVRHRYLFLEMTNLRELLDTRLGGEPTPRRPIGGVAFDS